MLMLLSTMTARYAGVHEEHYASIGPAVLRLIPADGGRNSRVERWIPGRESGRPATLRAGRGAGRALAGTSAREASSLAIGSKGGLA